MIMSNSSTDFNAPKVICIGEALLDRLGPLGGDPKCDKPVEDCLGGAPANVACGLANLGNDAAFIGRLGDDTIGESFQGLMQERGVNVSGLQIDSFRPSRVVLVRRDLTGERCFEGFYGDKGDGFADQAFELSDLKKVWSSLLQKVSWLMLGTIPLASSASEEASLWIVNQALKSKIKIAIDINWRPTFWDPINDPNSGPNNFQFNKITDFLEKASLLKLAKEEAIWFFNCQDPTLISRSLPKRPSVIVTDGSRPLRWAINGFDGEMEVFSPRSVVDTTGAGDAFSAGLLHQLLLHSEGPLDETAAVAMVRFAAACGALVCGGPGAIDPQPTFEEVNNFLYAAKGGIN